MTEAQIKITLKKTVADPQGLTVKHGLESLDFKGIKEVRMGKFVTLTLDENDKQKAKAQVEAMSKKLLANPIIEDFQIEIK